MERADRLAKLGLIDKETHDRSKELLKKVQGDFDKKADSLEERINNLILSL